MDKKGELFEIMPQIAFRHLPKLIGPLERRGSLLHYYQALSALLKPQGLQITVIRLDAENRCCIELMNGIQLLFGHFDACQQLQQLLEIHPSVLHHAEKVAALDLRYPNGMAVTWRTPIL